MADTAPLYDLTLLLSESASDEQRTKILGDVESAISRAGGSIERNDDWGRRPLAYEIRHQPDAEYHLMQFKAPGTLIEDLSHTLRITDGVLRFRVIKVRPGTPAAPSSPPPVVATAAPQSQGAPSRDTPARDTPAPSRDTPAPSADTPAPSSETPAPSSDTPAPSSDTPAPSSDTPAPSRDTPAPSLDTPPES
ncbi:MAG TPA: 30S ribosomal protein S6 [Solirubrobacteraceae bacterium]